MSTSTLGSYESTARLVAGWAALWKVPGLECRLHVRFSPRLRSSLGRYVASANEVRLASRLESAPADFLREVLCHEAAHAAVLELHGKAVKPHGSEWRQLMLTAGYEPRVSISGREIPESVRAELRPDAPWLHRCPVCQAARLARRPVRRWRCTSCHEAGLEGRLVISRVITERGAAG